MSLATSVHFTEDAGQVFADLRGVEFWCITDYIQGDKIDESFAWFSSVLEYLPQLHVPLPATHAAPQTVTSKFSPKLAIQYVRSYPHCWRPSPATAK
jgi:hypothetical protein